ncbi:MAG: hypothetical protein AB7P49_14735, partial [Bdellovibrionales bacterium]
EMIEQDMRMNKAQYLQRRSFIYSLGKDLPPVHFLLLSFQETYFYPCFDHILDGEYSKFWKSMRVGTAVSIIMGVSMSAHPLTRHFLGRVYMIAKNLVLALLQKRPLVIGSSAVASSGPSRLSVGDRPNGATECAEPPLFDPDSPNTLDSRTNHIFLKQFLTDLTPVVGGIATGWWSAVKSSSFYKRHSPYQTWSQILGPHPWTEGRIARFASPTTIVALGVSWLTTELTSRAVIESELQLDYYLTRDKLDELLAALKKGIADGDEYAVWIHAERLKNELLLKRYFLIKDYVEARQEEGVSRARAIDRALKYCAHKDFNLAKVVEGTRAKLKKNIGKLINKHDRPIKTALLLSTIVQEALLDSPHPFTENLIRMINLLVIDNGYMLDAEVSAERLWVELVEPVISLKGPCPPPRPQGAMGAQ